MNERKDLEELYERAIKNARARGLGEEAEDFASWLTIQWLEGKSQHQTLNQSLIDYRRGVHGNVRTSSGRARQSAERRYVTITPAEDDEAGQAALRVAERAAYDVSRESESHRIVDHDFASYLSGRTQLAYILVQQEERPMTEVADLLGISLSRVSQILTGANKEIAKYLMLEDMRERVLNGDTELRIEWITL